MKLLYRDNTIEWLCHIHKTGECPDGVFDTTGGYTMKACYLCPLNGKCYGMNTFKKQKLAAAMLKEFPPEQVMEQLL